MKLEEIKEQYAKEFGCKSWSEYKEDCFSIKDIESDFDAIAKLYAKQKLKEAAANADLKFVPFTDSDMEVDRASITNIILD